MSAVSCHASLVPSVSTNTPVASIPIQTVKTLVLPASESLPNQSVLPHQHRLSSSKAWWRHRCSLPQLHSHLYVCHRVNHRGMNTTFSIIDLFVPRHKQLLPFELFNFEIKISFFIIFLRSFSPFESFSFCIAEIAENHYRIEKKLVVHVFVMKDISEHTTCL